MLSTNGMKVAAIAFSVCCLLFATRLNFTAIQPKTPSRALSYQTALKQEYSQARPDCVNKTLFLSSCVGKLLVSNLNPLSECLHHDNV